jgi:membrane-bound ClpP family serine protease
MEPWAWAIVIFSAGLALAMLEVFVPSGGVLGFLSLAAVVVSIVLAFRHSPGTGFTFLGLAIVGLPAAFTTALHFFPRTRMGQRMILGAPSDDEVISEEDPRKALRAMVGKHGVTLSVMLPSGRVRIDDRLYDAMSEGLPIEANQQVTVIDVRGGSLVVRISSQEPPRKNPTDPLARPIESWGIDPFNDTSNS